MSLYQIRMDVVDSSDLSNPFINMFYYNVDDVVPTSTTAAALMNEFYDTVVNSATGWKTLTVAASVAKALVCTSPFSETVLAIRSMTVLGTRTGTAAPRFVAWGFKSDRTVANIRAGFKRFGRISEADTSGDVPASGMGTVLAAFALNLSAALDFSDGVSAFHAVPVIVKRIAYTDDDGKKVYRLPANDAEFYYSDATNWDYQSITTQNSRKR